MTPILSRIPQLSALLLAATLAFPAIAADEETLTEIVNVLREEGLIDEDEHAELAAKAAKRDEKAAWTDRFRIWGDFRVRFEHIDFNQDVYGRSTGMSYSDRSRGRYRARINASADVNSRATVYLRIATGGLDPRSLNQTLGSGNDFDTDDVRFDMAYATLTPFPDGELPGVEDGYLAVDVGKLKNPYRWKKLVADSMLWDSDITPEGAQMRIKGDAGPVALFANTGVYIIDENSGSKDPKLFAGQMGGTIGIADDVSFGARGSLYHFFSLDNAFYARAALNPGPGGTGGNLSDGIGKRNNSIQVVETAAFLEFTMSELFPVMVFGSYANNFSAQNSLVFPTEDRQDDAWSTGIYVGDKGQLVRLGLVYYFVEANAFPSMFLDSNVTDGFPNRKGWVASLERDLFEGVSIRLRGFASKRIEGGLAHVNSGPMADRLRGQADMSFAF